MNNNKNIKTNNMNRKFKAVERLKAVRLAKRAFEIYVEGFKAVTKYMNQPIYSTRLGIV
ncbi:MAG: hypothetical protein K5893_11715 [Prevotella sp.]|nr:hypothetical protein [Prevotella sp.]